MPGPGAARFALDAPNIVFAIRTVFGRRKIGHVMNLGRKRRIWRRAVSTGVIERS
jgi:hypothetical protein